jgi:Domain of unknown function (DUF4189)
MLCITNIAAGRAMKVCKAALLLAVLAPVLAPAGAVRSWAWGAVAVGSSGNLAKDGFAFGGAVDQPSEEAAKTAALEVCRKFEGAPKMAALCKVVKTLHHQCYSLAFDPDAGMPGTGWAFSPDKARAEREALGQCRRTAGASRRKFCKVSQSYCDTRE